MRAAIEQTGRLLEQLGHEIVPAEDPLDVEPATDAFQTLWSYNAAAVFDQAVKSGAVPEAVLEPYTLRLAERFKSYASDRVPTAMATLRVIEQTFDGFLSNYDAWLSPVASTPPPALGILAPTVDFETLDERLCRYVAYTAGHNVAGTPAISVPMGFGPTGLPIGSQLSAGKGCERVLFELAYELESAAPWHSQWPSIGTLAQQGTGQRLGAV